jgi:hypothetical protein
MSIGEDGVSEPSCLNAQTKDWKILPMNGVFST